MRQPNNITFRPHYPVFFGRSYSSETEREYKSRLNEANRKVRLNPNTLETKEAEKLYEWLGRFLEWKKEQHNDQ